MAALALAAADFTRKDSSSSCSFARRLRNVWTEISLTLSFLFTKNPSLALPILKFCSNHTISLSFEFENIENLYTVYSDIYNMNISSSYYNNLHNERISISNFVKDINFNAHVEATYIVLDCYERQLIINKANI